MIKNYVNGVQPHSVEELAENNGQESMTPMADLAKGFQANNDLLLNLMADKAVQQKTAQSPEEKTKEEEKEELKASRKAKRDAGCISNNLVSGQSITALVKTYNPPYNPSNPELAPATLDAKNLLASNYVDAVAQSGQLKKDDINQRQLVYSDLKPLARRVRNELIACGASDKVIKDASHFVDLINGERIIKIKPVVPPKKHISAIHTTFAQQIQNLNGLIKVLNSEPLYAPNQADITIAALEQKLDDMKVSNTEYYNAHAAYSTTIKVRNKFFNAAKNGYVDTYLGVKHAVKAMYGNTSTEYNQIKGFTLRRIDD